MHVHHHRHYTADSSAPMFQICCPHQQAIGSQPISSMSIVLLTQAIIYKKVDDRDWKKRCFEYVVAHVNITAIECSYVCFGRLTHSIKGHPSPESS